MDGKHLIALGAGVSPFAAGGGAVVPTFCSCVERIPFDVINSYYVATKSVIFWGGVHVVITRHPFRSSRMMSI